MSEGELTLFGTDGLARRSSRPKVHRTKPYTRAACPSCSAQAVGLDLTGSGHLIWRDHDYWTTKDVRIQCRVSGQLLCDRPARDVRRLTGEEPPTCPL